MTTMETVIPTFQVVDYVVFIITLVVSMGIGVYFAFRGNDNTEDFLLGGRKMAVLPVALSLLSSFISAVGILGSAGEIYGHGLQISMQLPGFFIGIPAAAIIFLPVFYPLEMTSINEYIEMRFRSRHLRHIILVINASVFLVVAGLALYAPTLALASVTPISTDTYIIILGVICTLYSTIGGIKAVVWTDTFQMIVIMIGIVIIITVGASGVGGISGVWAIAQEHGRTELFDMKLNIYERHNFPNLFLMGIIYSFTVYGCCQTTMQRACSVSSTAEARRVYFLNLVGLSTCMILNYMAGLCAFANYAGCDPISRGHIFSKDQILPYFIMDKIGFIYGMPGLFVATLISGTLSSLSSFINSVVAMVWSDCLNKITFFSNLSPKAATTTNKITSLVVGCVVILLAFLSKRYGGLLQASLTLVSIMGGPLIGIFSVGVFIPQCGKKGAWAGFLASVIIMSWIAIGATLYRPRPELLELSTENCPVDNWPQLGNATAPVTDVNWMNSSPNSLLETVTSTLGQQDDSRESISEWPMMYIYGISYTLYTAISCGICILVAVLTTLITGAEDWKDVRPELLAPCIRRFLPLKDSKPTVVASASYTPIKTVKYHLRDLKIPPPHLMSPSNPRRLSEC